MVGLAAKENAYPAELSEVRNNVWPLPGAWPWTPISSFDEPTSALDPTMVSEVLG